MASSISSSTPTHWDVFLSFGKKNRFFIAYLYDSLCRNQIKTFIDTQKLTSGRLDAIKQSEIYIVVISENFASSYWCLDDLVEILECSKSLGRLVLPIFYHIDPSVVRYQEGTFQKAFEKHKGRFDMKVVEKWRTALQEVADCSGYGIKGVDKYDRDEKLCEEIVKEIVNRVKLQMEKTVVSKGNVPRKMGAVKDSISSSFSTSGIFYRPKPPPKMMGAVKDSISSSFSTSSSFYQSKPPPKILGLADSKTWTSSKDFSIVRSEFSGGSTTSHSNKGEAKLYGENRESVKLEMNYSIDSEGTVIHKMGAVKDSILRSFDRLKLSIPPANVKLLALEDSKTWTSSKDFSIVRSEFSGGSTTSHSNNLDIIWKLLHWWEGMKQVKLSSTVMFSKSLKVLDLSYTQSLVRSPPFSAIQNLEILTLCCCPNLVEISQSIELVKRLSSLDLRDCKSLRNFPKNISTLRFLKTLNLSGCSSLPEFPTGLINLESIKEYHADDAVAVFTLLTTRQADMMELVIDFPKRSFTMLDTTYRFAQIGKARLEDKVLSQKYVKTLHLKVINLANNKLSEFPNNLDCPSLEKLFLQSNPDLRDIPSSFFEKMPLLKVLDMSDTSIKQLPPSTFRLVRLEELVLRGCELLIELPHEIGELKSLKILDLEGTDLVCLPKELGELINLEILNVSLYDAESYRKNKQILAIIPISVLSTLTQLKELKIHVEPHDVWWNDAIRAIFKDLPSLRRLKSLELYVPATELLQDFLKLEWNKYTRYIYWGLSHFCFIVGTQAPRIISRVPLILEEEFLKFDRCIKHVNGKDNIIQLAEALKYADALYLDRHWTIEKLSVFKLDVLKELKFCLLVDCNEMQSVFDGDDFYQGLDNGDNALSLRYLGIFYQKNLEFIWKGPFGGGCLSCLKVLAVHKCPKLTFIFTPILLQYLVNLTEIIVEDCSQIKILISMGSFVFPLQQFLPRLKKLSLLSLPELESISGSFQFGPILETMIIYDCPKLKSLYCEEVCNHQIKEVKGDNEWWNSLEWYEAGFSGGQPGYLSSAYSQLDIEKDLLDESAPLYGISVPL